MIKFKDILFEADTTAAQQAKQKGLKSIGFGRWIDKAGKVVAKTINGALQFIKPHEEIPWLPNRGEPWTGKFATPDDISAGVNKYKPVWIDLANEKEKRERQNQKANATPQSHQQAKDDFLREKAKDLVDKFILKASLHNVSNPYDAVENLIFKTYQRNKNKPEIVKILKLAHEYLESEYN